MRLTLAMELHVKVGATAAAAGDHFVRGASFSAW